MKSVFFAVLALIGLVSFGCSSVSKIGVAGDTTYFNVHAANLDGPNTTTIVAVKDGKSEVVQSYGGPGLLTSVAPAAVSAGGQVWAYDRFGNNLQPDVTRFSNSAGGGTGGQSTVTGVTGGAGGAGGSGGQGSATGGSATGGVGSGGSATVHGGSGNQTTTVR